MHNIKHVGECSAQLVNCIRDAGSEDIHVIGFSLGAQVANYISNSLKPEYLLPRITGLGAVIGVKSTNILTTFTIIFVLDPALPLFVTSDIRKKLDPSDAKYVDVFHCNVSFKLSCLNVIKTLVFHCCSGLNARTNRTMWDCRLLHKRRHLSAGLRQR